MFNSEIEVEVDSLKRVESEFTFTRDSLKLLDADSDKDAFPATEVESDWDAESDSELRFAALSDADLLTESESESRFATLKDKLSLSTFGLLDRDSDALKDSLLELLALSDWLSRTESDALSDTDSDIDLEADALVDTTVLALADSDRDLRAESLAFVDSLKRASSDVEADFEAKLKFESDSDKLVELESSSCESLTSSDRLVEKLSEAEVEALVLFSTASETDSEFMTLMESDAVELDSD
ncbi:hypothetical protein AB1I63_04595 [Streptococcus pneumoniae]